MNGAYLALGVSLLVIGTVDIVWTTLWVQGRAGPFTSWLMKEEWEILRRIVGHRPAVLSSQLELPLNTTASQLNTLTANHKAYPILHYFHSKRAKHAPVLSMVVLGELLTFLQFGTPKENQPDDLILRNARLGVENYLETLRGVFIDPADHSPPSLDLRALRKAGIPTVPDREFTEALGDVQKRRRQLLALIKSDTRSWPNQDSQ